MASAADNARTLFAYWTEANRAGAVSLHLAPLLIDAVRAMHELVDQARALGAASARAQVIGSLGVFEAALTAEGQGPTDDVIRAIRANFQLNTALRIYDSRARPPRQILLEGIYATGTSWWKSSDPSGVTSWVLSAPVSAGAVASTLKIDPNPWVRASTLKILGDLAIPEAWARTLTSTNAIAELEAQLVASSWDASTRATLQALAATAAGRVQQQMQVLPIDGFPAFKTGNGDLAATLPPRARTAKGPLIAGSALGLLSGALAHRAARARAAK